MKNEILHDFYDCPIAGAHQGFSQTWLKIKTRFHWSHYVGEIKEYTNSCRDCLNYKIKIAKPYGILQLILGNEVSKRWEINIQNLLKNLLKEKKYLVVAVEQITKWVEAKAVSSEPAKESAKVFMIN